MNRTIAVPLNDMNQIAMTWRHTVTEMDAVIQQVSRELSAIPDRAKGLNEVRAKGHQISAQHRQMAQDGLAVYQHVVDSAQRFAQAEQELTRMMSSQPVSDVTKSLLLAGGGILVSGMVQELGKAGTSFNGSGVIDSLLQFGDKLNYVNELGLALQLSSKYPDLAKRFTEYASKLNFWPATKAGAEASEKFAGKLGYALLALSLAKDGMDAYSAYQQNDVQRGRTEIANMVANAGFAGTVALANAVAPGSGLVIVGVQIGSDGLEYAADKIRAKGYGRAADVVQFLSDQADLQGQIHDKAMYFFRLKDAYEDGGVRQVASTIVNDKINEVTNNAKRFADFVGIPSSQVKETASKLYEYAQSATDNWLWNRFR